jgi:hypothetical protein
MALYMHYRAPIKGYKYDIHQYFIGTLQEIAAIAPLLLYHKNRLHSLYL